MSGSCLEGRRLHGLVQGREELGRKSDRGVGGHSWVSGSGSVHIWGIPQCSELK